MAIESTREEAEKVFSTNFFAVIEMVRVFADSVIAAKGTLVFTGSVAGYAPFVAGSVYNASKGALHSYLNTLRVELRPFHVKVINIVTGGVKTPIWDNEITLRPGQPNNLTTFSSFANSTAHRLSLPTHSSQARRSKN